MASLSTLVEPTLLLWREKRAYVGNVTGPFVNRNTAATYFGSCAAIWLLILSERIRERLPEGPLQWKPIAQQFLSKLRKNVVVAFLAFFSCFIALLMTESRAGVMVSLLAFVVAFTLFFRRDLPKRSGLAGLGAGAIAVVLLLVQVFGGAVNRRFDTQNLSDEGRLDTYRATLHMIADHPWFGTGLGTFVWSFPSLPQRRTPCEAVWDLAHSTPLELAADLGLPLAAVIGLAWIVILGASDPRGALAAAGMASFPWRRSPLRSSACCIPWWTSACRSQAMPSSLSRSSASGSGNRFER